MLSTSSRTYTQGETHRDLMTADESRTMRDGTLLVFISKYHPMLVQNTAYYQDAALSAEVNTSYTPPASRVTVTPVPPTPPPVMGLSAPRASATQATQRPPAGPPPKTPPKPKAPPTTNQNDGQFFSPE